VGEFSQIAVPALAALALACTVLNAIVAVVLAKLSLPAKLRARLEVAESEVVRMRQEVGDVTAQAKLWRSSIEGLIEQADDAFERAERKRASAAAKVSRLEGGAAPARSSFPDRASLIAHLRANHGGH
jgi:acyl-coenzyme A synthetase/AMP-(fatty) acid ligase